MLPLKLEDQCFGGQMDWETQKGTSVDEEAVQCVT